jgi:hypothetical protein
VDPAPCSDVTTCQTATVTVGPGYITLDGTPAANYVAGTSVTGGTTSAITTNGYVGEIIFFDLEIYYAGTGLGVTATCNGSTMASLASKTYTSATQSVNHFLFYFVTTSTATSYSATFTSSKNVAYLSTNIWAVKAISGYEALSASNISAVTTAAQAGSTSCSGTASVTVTTPASPSIPAYSYLMATIGMDDNTAGAVTENYTTGVGLISGSSDVDGDEDFIGGMQESSSTSSVLITATDSKCNYAGASIFSFWVHP